MASKIRPDKDTLARLYLVENRTQTEIGIMYGVTAQCISHWCVQYGLKKAYAAQRASGKPVTEPDPIPAVPTVSFASVPSYRGISTLGLPVKRPTELPEPVPKSVSLDMPKPVPRVSLVKGTLAVYVDTDRVGITRLFTVDEGKQVDEAAISGAKILEAFRHPGLRRLVLKIEA